MRMWKVCKPRLSCMAKPTRSEGASTKAKRSSRTWIWLVSFMVIFAAVWLTTVGKRLPSLKMPVSPQIATLSNRSLTTQSWKRLRLHTPEEVERSFDTITAYIERPELAQSLEAISFDRIRKYVRYRENQSCRDVDWDFSDPVPLPLKEDLTQTESKLQQAIMALDLPENHRQRICTAIIWKAQNRSPGDLGSAESSNWMYYRTDEHYEYASAVFVLLCALSPNLHTIHTTPPNHFISDFLLAANRNRLGSPILTRLKDLMLFTSQHEFILNDERFYHRMPIMRSIRHFDRLPSLSSIRTQIITDHDDEDMPMLPPGLSLFSSISVTNAGLDSSVISSLIRGVEKLENVTFTSGGRAVQGGHTFMVHPKSIGKCLEPHKDTLQSIDLDLDQYLWPNPHLPDSVEEEDGMDRQGERDDEYLQETLEYTREKDADWKADEEESIARGHVLLSHELPDTKPYGATIGSFAEFQALRTLKIGIGLLLGPAYSGYGPRRTPPVGLIDMLPQGLTHLEIRGYRKGRTEEWDAEVDRFIEMQASRLPRLTLIKGVDAEIPNGRDVDRPDDNYDSLFVVPEEDDGWLEA